MLPGLQAQGGAAAGLPRAAIDPDLGAGLINQQAHRSGDCGLVGARRARCAFNQAPGHDGAHQNQGARGGHQAQQAAPVIGGQGIGLIEEHRQLARGRTLARRLAQAAFHHQRQSGRNAIHDFAQRLQPGFEVGAHDLIWGAGEEGRAPGQHVIEGGAKGIDVGGEGSAQRIADAFRRYIEGGSDDDASGGEAIEFGIIGLLGQAEIGDLGASIGADQDIIWLDVAVDDALGMDGGESQGDLGADARRHRRRQMSGLVQHPPQAMPDHQFHDQVGDAIAFARVHDLDHMRMLDARRGPALAQEALFGMAAVAGLIEQDLDRDLTAQFAVPAPIHRPHRPAAKHGGQSDMAIGLVEMRIGNHVPPGYPQTATPPSRAVAAGPPGHCARPALPLVAGWRRQAAHPMLPVTTAQLPGVSAQCYPADRAASEVLAQPPARGGDHWWIRVAKTDLSTQQARAAIARSVAIPVEAVACAGNRDRAGRCLQWFSVPVDLVDAPGPLRRAGAHGKMQVLEVTRSHQPMRPEAVQRLQWTLRLRQGAAQDGYRLLQARMDVLRQQGMANYSAHGARDHGQLARWGRLLVQGRRLPGPVAQRQQPGPCLRAFQDSLFNRAVALRVTDGLLARVLPGDRLRDRRGNETLAEDLALAQRRVDSWDAVMLGPCFGSGMAPVAGEAAAREAALLAHLRLPAAGIARLHGYRRAIRVQPTQVRLDINGPDLEVHCELPLEAGIGVLLSHLLAPEGTDAQAVDEVGDAGLDADQDVDQDVGLGAHHDDRAHGGAGLDANADAPDDPASEPDAGADRNPDPGDSDRRRRSTRRRR